MSVRTAVTFDDQVYATMKACAAAAGVSMATWLNRAAREAARRENAMAYGDYLAARTPDAVTDEAAMDEATLASIPGYAEW